MRPGFHSPLAFKQFWCWNVKGGDKTKKMKTWKIDPNHSEITFKVKHLVITTVSGKFTKFDSSLETEKPDFSDAVIRFSADVNSITTGNDQRDNHLRSADFFDAENHP